MWDAEVDLVCVGAGIGGLATAIATVDAGGDVIVADTSPDVGSGDVSSVATRRRVGSLRGWLQHDVLDIETDDYFAAVAEGLDPLAQRVDTAHVPTRLASVWRADNRTVEPFIGSAMRAWDAKCLASPHGMLYTTISGRPTTKMRSNGELIEVMPVGDDRPERRREPTRPRRLDGRAGVRTRHRGAFLQPAAAPGLRGRSHRRRGLRPARRSVRRSGASRRDPVAAGLPAGLGGPTDRRRPPPTGSRCASSDGPPAASGASNWSPSLRLPPSTDLCARCQGVSSALAYTKPPVRFRQMRGVAEKWMGIRPFASSASISAPLRGCDNRKPCAR